MVPYPERRPTGTSPSDPAHWLLPTGRSGWSIAAGYVALFALVLWPLGPVALACGWALGLRHSARTGTHGRGRAWFGVVVGALATLGCPVWGEPHLAVTAEPQGPSRVRTSASPSQRS